MISSDNHDKLPSNEMVFPRLGHTAEREVRIVRVLQDGFVLPAYVYLSCLVLWACLRLVFGDQWWWLFLLNSFTIYLFVPLVFVIVIAIATQQPALWFGVTAALALLAYWYGGLFVPRPAKVEANDTVLKIVSFNLLASNPHTIDVITALRVADGDVVAFQELSPVMAMALEQQLFDEYPYQMLEPREGVAGMGVISRYPLAALGRTLPGPWLGSPQLVTINIGGIDATLLNFHNVSIPLGVDHWTRRVSQSVREREQQARAIVDFVAQHPGPFIAVADFNATDQSKAYRIITQVLHDAWRRVGLGLGHTFPGSASEGNARLEFWGIPVPMGLARIDYVFYSSHWDAVSARVGPLDGGSDHRPVVVELRLVKS